MKGRLRQGIAVFRGRPATEAVLTFETAIALNRLVAEVEDKLALTRSLVWSMALGLPVDEMPDAEANLLREILGGFDADR